MKGFLAGMIVGTIVVALGLAVASEIAPMPTGGQPQVAVAAVPAVPAGAVVAKAPAAPARPPARDATPVTEPTPSAASPLPMADASAPVVPAAADPVASSQPQAESADPIMDLPSAAAVAAAEAGSATPGASMPAVDAAPPVELPVPATATAVTLETSPDTAAQEPVAPEPSEAPMAETGPILAEVTALPPPTPKAPEVSERATDPLANADPAQPDMPADDATDARVPTVIDENAPEAGGAAVAAANTPPDAATPAGDALVILPVPEEPPARGVAPDVEMVAEPRPGPVPEPGLDGGVDGVTVGRLPRIGTPEAATEVAPETPAATPLAQFTRDFENSEGKPAFAIVLIDQGLPEADRARLAALPFPVTFALDPTMPMVAEAAATYRAAGQEVAMLATGLPQGATAADVEVTFEAHARALPEAVVVLDLESGGFQSSRPLATMVVPVIGGQGRGVVTWDEGLNAGVQVAQRDGVAAGTVFRRFDPEGASVPTMRRNLDRAAFKAAQDGRVIVVGNARADLIPALLAWTMEGRAASVALAPVSAVLTEPAG